MTFQILGTHMKMDPNRDDDDSPEPLHSEFSAEIANPHFCRRARGKRSPTPDPTPDMDPRPLNAVKVGLSAIPFVIL
jgi:hypothetical protein